MKQERAFLFCLSSAIIWGTSFPIIKWVYLVYPTTNPLLFLLFRFIACSTAIIIVAIALRKKIQFDIRPFKNKRLFVIGVLNAIGFMFQYFAQIFTTASKTSLIVTLNILIVTVLSVLIFKEKITQNKFIGLVLGITGVVILITNGDSTFLFQGELIGDLLAFGASVSWALVIIELKKALSDKNYEEFSVSFASMLYTTLAIGIASLPLPLFGPLVFEFNPITLFAIIYTGVVNTFLGFTLWNLGLKRISASTSMILLLPQITISIILGILFLGEPFSVFSLLGSAGIFLSVYFTSRTVKK
ncbi:MAG: DMT family transporter [Candidatus Ranarchaeia archaeon]